MWSTEPWTTNGTLPYDKSCLFGYRGCMQNAKAAANWNALFDWINSNFIRRFASTVSGSMPSQPSNVAASSDSLPAVPKSAPSQPSNVEHRGDKWKDHDDDKWKDDHDVSNSEFKKKKQRQHIGKGTKAKSALDCGAKAKKKHRTPLHWSSIDFERPRMEEAEKPAEEEAKKKHRRPLDWSPIDFERPWKEEAEKPAEETENPAEEEAENPPAAEEKDENPQAAEATP